MVTNRDRKWFGSQRKKFQKLPRQMGPLTFLIHDLAFRDPLRGELPNPLTWDAQLLSYWFSRNPAVFQDYLVNLIYNLTVLGRPGRGAPQVEKSPRLNWATQFLTVAYDGACSPNVSVRMAWISFGALPCRKIKLDDSSRLDVVEIKRVALHASFQQQEKTCNSAHEQTSLSNDTIDSVRHREVGGIRTYQHPLVQPDSLRTLSPLFWMTYREQKRNFWGLSLNASQKSQQKRKSFFRRTDARRGYGSGRRNFEVIILTSWVTSTSPKAMGYQQPRHTRASDSSMK